MAFQNNNVLIVGDRTGKEIAAQSIHRMSARKTLLCNTLNCAAIPEADRKYPVWNCKRLVYRKFRTRQGFWRSRQEDALLDELNSRSLSMQAKVLRALQEGTFSVWGSKEADRCKSNFHL